MFFLGHNNNKLKKKITTILILKKVFWIEAEVNHIFQTGNKLPRINNLYDFINLSWESNLFFDNKINLFTE